MTSPVLRPFAAVEINAQTFSSAAGEVSLDSGRFPYGEATITLPLVDPADLEDIDPRDGLRVLLTAGDDRPGTSRTFDLGLRSRTVDHEARTVEIVAATDEALLTDYAVLAEDKGARAHEASLRAVVDYVLGKIGATLEPGTTDADVTAFWAVTNHIKNGSAEAGISGWVAASNCTLFASSPWADAPSGTGAVGVTASGAGTAAVSPFASLTEAVSVTPGRSYVFSGYARQYQTSPARVLQPYIRWFDVNGAQIGADRGGAIVPLSSTAWARGHVIVTAPPGAVKAWAAFNIGGFTASGQIAYIDAAMFYEGTELVPYFDGNTPDAGGYEYTWTGTAGASSSTRTPDVERPPELFTWAPGVTAWEFLEPLTAVAGYRLYCDEQRRWYLIDPAVWSKPGLLSVAGWNTTKGTDEITLGDPEKYATGVVVRYTWEDAHGIQRHATDSAGTPGLIRVIELARPFPGAGVAAAVLSRMTGRGRVQEVTALANWTTDPGMQARITLPGTHEQAGQVAHVAWGLSDGLMRIETNALTDVVPGSIAALLGTIDALTGTIDNL